MQDDEATIIFGPAGTPHYRAAKAIQEGKSIDDADLAGVRPEIDRSFKEGEFTLLQFAWRRGDVPAIEQLIANGADWRRPLASSGQLARQDLLFLVLTSGEPKAGPTMRILLAHGLDPNTRKPGDGDAPILLKALVMHNFEVEKALVEAGADPWLGRRGPVDQRSGVEVAIDTGNYDFLEWLLDRGAFDRRPPADVRPVLSNLAKQPRNNPQAWAVNRKLAAEIVSRSKYPHDELYRSDRGRPEGDSSPEDDALPPRFREIAARLASICRLLER